MYLSQRLLDRIEQRRERSQEQPRQLLNERDGAPSAHDERGELLREVLSGAEQPKPDYARPARSTE